MPSTTRLDGDVPAASTPPSAVTRAPSTSAPLAATTSSASRARLVLERRGRRAAGSAGRARGARPSARATRSRVHSAGRQRRRTDCGIRGLASSGRSCVGSTQSTRGLDAARRWPLGATPSIATPVDRRTVVARARRASQQAPMPPSSRDAVLVAGEVAPVRRRRRRTRRGGRRPRRRPTTSRSPSDSHVAVEAEGVGERAHLRLVDVAG